MRIVIIADHGHHSRAVKELRNLGHAVSYAEHKAGTTAIPHDAEWVVLMASSQGEIKHCNAKVVGLGARLVQCGVGWPACRAALEAAGFPFTVPEQLEIVPAEPEVIPAGPAELAVVAQPASALPVRLGASDCLTMSSLEIAELTGKRHDNVLRDIRKMLVELHGEGGLLRFEDAQGSPAA